MPYLIDGNNLLGLSSDLLIKDPGARGRLVRQLGAFARGKRTRVIVVFDGEPEPGMQGASMQLGDVQVLFAGRTSDADRRILRILGEADDPAGYVLVTSDRALAEQARRMRARQVTSLRFRRALDAVADPSAGGDAPLSSNEVAEWEAWFNRPKPEE